MPFHARQGSIFQKCAAWFLRLFTQTRLKPLTSMDTVGEHEALKRKLMDLLGPKLLFAATDGELCAHIVERLSVPMPVDVHDQDALAAECHRLLTEMGQPCPSMSPREVFAAFLREVMAFAELPAARRRKLEREIEEDLVTLDALLAKYAREKVVQDHLVDERPHDHFGNALVTFYVRCAAQKIALERYLESELDSQALAQCTVEHHEMLKWMPLLFGPRLPISHPRALARFDYWSIDRCGHRVKALPIAEARELKALYGNADFTEFYKRLKARVPESTAFGFAAKVIARHPELQARGLVLKELEWLWKEGRWLAFHALALPQVEGLIGDMLRVAGIEANSGALPDKVGKVVPLTPVDESAFDYFQWLVPFTRNSFSHNGLEPEPERRAHDDLYDLLFLFEVFANLETPIILLRKLFDERNLKEPFKFPTVFTTFFHLVDKLPKGHEAEVVAWVDRILAEADVAAVIASVELAAREATDSFAREFREFAGVDLLALSPKDVWQRRDELGASLERYRDAHFQDDRVDQINAIEGFLAGFKRHLRNAPKETLASLARIAKEHSECWGRLRKLGGSTAA